MDAITFPRMVYRVGAMVALESGSYDYKIAGSAKDAEGWHLDQYAAKAAHGDSGPLDNAAPTRAELEQKAAELGITFSHRTGDKKLAEKIAAALKD